MLRETSEILAKVAHEMAYNFEKTYHGCSQAVMRGVLHALGMHEEVLFAAAFPFGGGLGLKQGICGALVGGVMCLGMASQKYGRPWDEFNKWDANRILESLNAAGLFYERCKEAMGGTVNCREITGMDIKSVEDMMRYTKSPQFETCCQNCGIIAGLVVQTLVKAD